MNRLRDHAWFDREWASADRAVKRVVLNTLRFQNDDVVQEIRIRCWSSRESYDGGRPFVNWACRVASRLCIDHVRYRTRPKRDRALTLPLDNPLPGTDGLTAAELIPDSDAFPGAALEEEVYRAWALGLAERTLNPLPFRIVYLSSLGMEYHEIGEELGCPTGTVRSNLHRARKKMREVTAA
jgi:RNA polymerase sigma-70 factor (ECF subfamily)